MKPHNHYEAAFEDFLLRRGCAFVAVDEARRAAFRDARIKSFDFILYSESGPNWLVDVKGRRWTGRGRRWENWVTQPDLDGLEQWQTVFGEGFRGLLVFAYGIESAAQPPAELLHAFRGRSYVFTGVPLHDYRLHARLRSPKWETLTVPSAEFARCVRPLADWL